MLAGGCSRRSTPPDRPCLRPRLLRRSARGRARTPARRARDGLLHEPLLEAGTTLSGWAHEHTAAEIRAGRLRRADGTPSDERPLILDELLGLAPPSVTLQLEVKAHADGALARRTALALCERLRHHHARERIEVISFWSGACELAARRGFRARLVLDAVTSDRPHELRAELRSRRDTSLLAA